MKFQGNIHIDKVIVHILNHKENKHTLNDFEITTNEMLNNLIIKHINTSIKNDTRMFAKFNNGDNIVRNSCSNILKNSNCFIEESKNISRELFKSMKGTNASPANFLIAEYMHGEKKAIALLKLDFNENFYTEEITKNNKTKIIIKLKNDSFNKNQKLQKCAFIYDDILKNVNSNIVILDKQTKDDVSNYFGSTFLNCSLVNDYKINTRNMIKELTNFINTKYTEKPEEQINKMFQLTNIFTKNIDFNLNNVLDNLFYENKTRDEFKEKIKEKEIDYEFKIDKPRVEKRLKSRSITTENGISLKGRASLFNSNDIKIENTNKNGYVNIIINKVKIKDNKF